jgi:nitrogen fixation/metabolism regulation signal transduction histidine kinase
MGRIFLGTSLGVMLLTTVWGLLISHRIAGPIYRMCLHLDLVANGKTEKDVSFRKKDFFPELAEAFNRHMRVVRGEDTKKNVRELKREGRGR